MQQMWKRKKDFLVQGNRHLC